MADVFAVVWRKLEASPVEERRAWIYGIARNVMRNRWRASNRRRRLLGRLGGVRSPLPLEPPESVVDSSPQRQRVRRALQELREADREILIMSAWDDLSAPEIATILGISANAAHQRIHRAKNRLASILSRPQDDTKRRLATEEGSA